MHSKIIFTAENVSSYQSIFFINKGPLFDDDSMNFVLDELELIGFLIRLVKVLNCEV